MKIKNKRTGEEKEAAGVVIKKGVGGDEIVEFRDGSHWLRKDVDWTPDK